MKKLMVMMLIAITVLPVFAERKGAEKITVSKIKVFLDDEELTPESENANKISRSTIISFTNLKEGNSISISALEREVKETEIRLYRSGLFYNATVEIVPPRKNPEKRTVIINVTTGFLLRFGGGAYYGVLGKAAVGGGRNQLLGVAGWNANGIMYKDENFLGTGIILGNKLITDFPAGLFQEEKSVNFNEIFSIGYLINADLRFCVDSQFKINTADGFVKESYIHSPYLFAEHFFSNQLSTSFELRNYYMPALYDGRFSGELCGTINYSPAKRINLAALVSGGTQFGNNQEDAPELLHNLMMKETALSEKALGKRAVRSGYEPQDLLVKNYVMASLEARVKVLDFTVGSIFPCKIIPFVYTDLAYGESVNKGWQFLDAYGTGVQLYFDCPVFAYFNMAYGWNHEGKGQFCFYTGMSF